LSDSYRQEPEREIRNRQVRPQPQRELTRGTPVPLAQRHRLHTPPLDHQRPIADASGCLRRRRSLHSRSTFPQIDTGRQGQQAVKL
jgi:hypothetical protein